MVESGPREIIAGGRAAGDVSCLREIIAGGAVSCQGCGRGPLRASMCGRFLLFDLASLLDEDPTSGRGVGGVELRRYPSESELGSGTQNVSGYDPRNSAETSLAATTLGKRHRA